MSTQWIMSGLDHGNASSRPGRQVLTAVWSVLFILAYYAFALFGLWNAWQSFNWTGFWTSAILAAIFSFAVPGSLFLNTWTANRLARAQVAGRGLLEIAAARDDRLVPPVAFQPAHLALSDLPFGKALIGPLKRMDLQLQGSQRTMTGIVPLTLLSFALVFAPLSLTFNDVGGSHSFFFTALPFLVFFVYFGWIAVFVVWAILRFRGRTFVANVDDTGLEWFTNRGRTRHHIAWGDVRSIFRVVLGGTAGYTTSVGSTWGMRTAYFIDGKNDVLGWSLTPLSGEQNSAASEALLRIAVTKAGKPLRDLTLLTNEVATSGRNAEHFLASRAPTSGQYSAEPLLGILPSPRTKTKRGYTRAWVVTAITTLLVVALLAGGLGLQVYQSTYISNLPAQLRQQQPLFQDTLAAPDSNWPNQLLDKPHNLDGMFFAGTSYQLTGATPGDFVLSLEQRQPFDNAAYEVTAHETGALPNDGYDGVGLAFRSDASGSDFLLFEVYSSGDWELYHYHYVSSRADDNWNDLDYGSSKAINTGIGSANKLLVVLRGQSFLLYVNDHLVYSTKETYETFADSGYAGVYLNDGSMAASFQNFAVYPVAKATPFTFGYI